VVFVVVSRFVLVEAPLSRGSKLEITWREASRKCAGNNDPTSTSIEADIIFDLRRFQLDVILFLFSFLFLLYPFTSKSRLQRATMNRIIPRCVRVTNRYPRITSFSRSFSVSISRRANTLMETSGFSDTQLQVREAIAKICSNFPDEYWAAHDESGEYPHELHAALAKDGWIGIALPEDLGGSGLGISEATMMLHIISE
jgi:hypothetical protein